MNIVDLGKLPILGVGTQNSPPMWNYYTIDINTPSLIIKGPNINYGTIYINSLVPNSQGHIDYGMGTAIGYEKNFKPRIPTFSIETAKFFTYLPEVFVIISKLSRVNLTIYWWTEHHPSYKSNPQWR
jgi:hypothetical protein